MGFSILLCVLFGFATKPSYPVSCKHTNPLTVVPVVLFLQIRFPFPLPDQVSYFRLLRRAVCYLSWYLKLLGLINSWCFLFAASLYFSWIFYLLWCYFFKGYIFRVISVTFAKPPYIYISFNGC